MVNRQNDLWFPTTPKHVLKVLKAKHPINIQVFGLITSDDKVMHALISPRCFKHKMKTYIKSLGEVVLPWVERLVTRRLYVWQEECAPCHTSRRIQSCHN